MSAVLDAIRQVTEVAEKIKNDSPQDFPIAANVGDAVRQGDIYIQLLEPLTKAPAFYTKIAEPVFPYQLAPGNTKGSRHCLEASDGVEIYVPQTDVLLDENLDGNDRFELGRGFREDVHKYAENLSSVAGVPVHEIAAGIIEAMDLAGPIFVLKNPTTVSHPEHGNWNLPAGTYRCVFQRTVSLSSNSIRRVLD
jgi:hypothetical protein